ncbi:MAG: biotin/lipoyl-binding protein [Clostridia bacterium]
MKRKQCAALLAAGMMALSIPFVGAAEGLAEGAAEGNASLILSAVVEPKEEIALKAPASGELSAFQVLAGDAAEAGEALFTVEPKRVYADLDGKVAAVYVQAGDIADAAAARYGAVVQLDYADRYEAQCNVRTGYNANQNRDLTVGMKVYLRSANEKHFADGRITELNGTSFTVQVLGGDLVYTEDVKVYREADYESKKLLARASLTSIAPYAVSVSGTVVEVAVKQGEAVQAGDFLFSYVPDALAPELRGIKEPTAVKAEQAMVLSTIAVSQGATVQKGQVLATGCPVGAYRLTAQAEESDVGKIRVGDVFTARFEELTIPAVKATVTAISPMGADAGEGVSKYKVYLDFEAPNEVWIGMHATVGQGAL